MSAEKFLIMIIAKHLLKIFERKKTKIIENENNLFEIEKVKKKINYKLSVLYIIHVSKNDHVCRCLVCQSNIKETLKQEIITKIKKIKKADLKQEVINFMTSQFVKQYEIIVKIEAMRKTKLKINTEIEKIFEAARRIVVESQIQFSMIASIRLEEKEAG